MEILIALIVIVAIGAIIYTNREARSLDINKDGKVDVEDVKVAVQNTVEAAKKTEVVQKAKATVAKAKTAVKKPAVKAKTAGRNGRKS
jgi:hypothetical protein